ncbi:hypothetical protein [Mucilaginibacter arboris]|uniref:Uncharacterized protein n=1 Tax=Mucilaginibacter arboris TaxID=2682090 RepID=A0A7K1SZG2_9SPHI|nr:hypothetical protein [Mucilaginibacter arboris]MVN22699.1 hypothetical protein [Mucilaginibacter arboris]
MAEGEYLYYNLPGTGYVRVYTQNKIVVPHKLIEKKFAKNFSGYRLISKDINLIFEALSELKSANDTKSIINQSLTFFIIITYGKCFAEADERDVKLETSSLKFCTDSEKGLHKELLNIRNNYIAHAGKSLMEKNLVLMTKIKTDDGFGFTVFDSGIFMSNFKIDKRIELIESLAAHVKQYVEEKIDTSYTKLHTYIAENLNWEDFDKECFIPNDKELIKIEDIEFI